jgi:hypothetical protein
MPLAKKESTGLWKSVPNYPNLEKTSDLEAFKEEFPKVAGELEKLVDEKEAADPEFFKNKGKVKVTGEDGYTYQVSSWNDEYQVTRWKAGSGKGRGGYGSVQTRITKTWTGDLAGFDKLIKKQAADESWEILKCSDPDTKGNVKGIFAVKRQAYNPRATAAEEKKSEESETESEDSE